MSKFLKKFETIDEALTYNYDYIAYAMKDDAVAYIRQPYILLSANGSGNLTINTAYVNDNGFKGEDGSFYSRMDSSEDREISGITYYAYDSEDVFYITEDISNHQFGENIKCNIYVLTDDDEIEDEWEDSIIVIKYSPTNENVSEETISYTVGDSQKIKCDTKIITLYSSDKKTLTNITLPNTVKYIDKNAFNKCTSLLSVIMNDSLISIGDRAFDHCTSLTSVTKTNNLLSIGDNAFNHCTNLLSIDLPNSVTSIGESAFYACSGITSINIPTGLTAININTFGYCSNLTSVNISENVTSIGVNAFANCTKLTSVTMHEGLLSIDYNAFNSCSNLTSIIIPNSVINIGHSTFAQCTNLTSVTIPNGITSINNHLFSSCTNLITINYKGTMAQWNAITKGEYWHYDVPSTTVVTCTDGTVQLDE